MTHSIKGLRQGLFALYTVVGEVALMLATPTGLRFLRRTDGMVSFLPAKEMGLAWSLPLYFMDDGQATALSVPGSATA